MAPPQHSWTIHLLEAISVKSYTPGRIRFAIGFPGDEILTDTLRRELQREPSVRLASLSSRTRTALVTYDPKSVDGVAVMRAFMRGILEYGRIHGECELDHHHHDAHTGATCGDEHDSCDHDHATTDADIRQELIKLAATGGVLGYFLYKKLIGKPIAFPGNPLVDVASLVTIASGYGIFRRGVESVQKKHKATDDTLISIAVIATLLMGESLTGLSVVWLINLGHLLEAITLKRSRTAIKELMDIAPTEAWVVAQSAPPGREPVEHIKKGTRIRVFRGEKVPLDGRVLSGEALVKEAFITGEALPVRKDQGQTVYAGSIVEAGEIDVEVTSLVSDTVVARIINAIENIRDKKAPIEKVGTRFASAFVPVSLGLFGVTLLFTGDLRRAITMLVIACPCAAGLATPTAVSASIGQAARRGILIKGGTHIEAAAHINAVVFDKTGTLTNGTPVLLRFIETEEGKSLGFEECLRIAASAEQHATHPLGLVLVAEARAKKLKLSELEKFTVHPGKGIHARLEGMTVDIGNRRHVQALKIEIPEALTAESLADVAAGESVLYLAIDKHLHGVFVVQDTLRPEAGETLEKMRAMGIRRLVMATGDQRAAAEHIARQLPGIEVHAELLPEAKLDLVKRLKRDGYRVAMIGDGINDAQALAHADLSIAMGAGHCDVAMESADITLARNDLRLAADVLKISDQTLRTIYQNFIASVGINVGGIGFSMLGKMTPFSAAIVHNASTIAVVLNSLRLGREVAGKKNPLGIIKEVIV